MSDAGNLTLQCTTISGGDASDTASHEGPEGGGLYNHRGTVTLSNSTITGNTAREAGGAVYNNFGRLSLTNSTISNNSAVYWQGGGIYNKHGSVTLRQHHLGQQGQWQRWWRYMELSRFPIRHRQHYIQQFCKLWRRYA